MTAVLRLHTDLASVCVVFGHETIVMARAMIVVVVPGHALPGLLVIVGGHLMAWHRPVVPPLPVGVVHILGWVVVQLKLLMGRCGWPIVMIRLGGRGLVVQLGVLLLHVGVVGPVGIVVEVVIG